MIITGLVCILLGIIFLVIAAVVVAFFLSPAIVVALALIGSPLWWIGLPFAIILMIVILVGVAG